MTNRAKVRFVSYLFFFVSASLMVIHFYYMHEDRLKRNWYYKIARDDNNFVVFNADSGVVYRFATKDYFTHISAIPSKKRKGFKSPIIAGEFDYPKSFLERALTFHGRICLKQFSVSSDIDAKFYIMCRASGFHFNSARFSIHENDSISPHIHFNSKKKRFDIL